MIVAWKGTLGEKNPRLTWRGTLGLFSEKTSGECHANLYNQDACYAICSSIGIGGWSALFIWPCVNQCMIEGCGQGILVSHTQMQKAGQIISPCFNACMDAFQQENIGTDEAALKAAAIQCANKCGFPQAVSSTPGGTKVTKSGGGSKTPAASSSTSSVATAAVAGTGLIWALGAAAILAYIIWGKH